MLRSFNNVSFLIEFSTKIILLFEELGAYIHHQQQRRPLRQLEKVKLNLMKKKLFNTQYRYLNVKRMKKNVKKNYLLNNMRCQIFNFHLHHSVQHQSLIRYTKLSLFLNKHGEMKDEIYPDHMFI
jgi:hypothetical protein